MKQPNMKYYILIIIIYISFKEEDQHLQSNAIKKFDTIKIDSHVQGLHVAMLHMPCINNAGNDPVLFIHGSSFPSVLSFGFRMDGTSWMDEMSSHNFESFALDFLGYGNADRHPLSDQLPGRASEASEDIGAAVKWILKNTGSKKVILIGHSWGSSVAALYATQHAENISKLVLFAPITLRNDSLPGDTVTTFYEMMTPSARVSLMQSLTPSGQTCQLEPAVFDTWQTQWLASDRINNATGQVKFPAGPLQDIDDLLHGKSYYNPSLITVPTLIIRGEWDDYPSDEDAMLLYSKLVNTSVKKYIVIKKGTHVLHLEKNRWKLYQEVNHFISEPF